MSSVRITQIDGKLPNLALMRIASFHRKRGDEVEDGQHHKQRAVADLRDEHAEQGGEGRRAEVAHHPAHAGGGGDLVLSEHVRGHRVQRPRQGLEDGARRRRREGDGRLGSGPRRGQHRDSTAAICPRGPARAGGYYYLDWGFEAVGSRSGWSATAETVTPQVESAPESGTPSQRFKFACLGS